MYKFVQESPREYQGNTHCERNTYTYNICMPKQALCTNSVNNSSKFSDRILERPYINTKSTVPGNYFFQTKHNNINTH